MSTKKEAGVSRDWFLYVRPKVPRVIQCIAKAVNLYAYNEPRPHTCMYGTHDLMPRIFVSLFFVRAQETNPLTEEMITAFLVAYF